ncbi:hypothetical protein [Tropicibacter naphthalenivorans]|uniref:Sulfotransferase family protein n=1 Tax=Tropicibacter naphthalenivorans TaxID=441103 RepID=A0A0P1GFQ5_9RHOB|nr:hypothetical protein [Tropicibacter naphthalenivorans]CUH80342.1 hypothetical protein TRN7648_02938 [Tropicibacter naphthalenivorans]SMC85923.1 hypothetical protein SAMN04488093_105207 [Tropicibacter naphthalenivorans]
MTQLWLHIGTQKTGSTAIQHFGQAQAAFLARHDVQFVKLVRRSSLNRLPKALRRGDLDFARHVGGLIEEGIAQATARNIVLSSEMLSANGVDLAQLAQILPSLTRLPLNIVVYLRRQDRFMESHYRQRVKNGRYGGPISSYIKETRDAYGDYDRLLRRWEEGFPQARIYVRRFEKGHLKDEDIISDFNALLGVSHVPHELRAAPINASPSDEMLTMLHLLKAAGGYDVARLRKAVEARCGDLGRQARLLSAAQARALMDYYAASNEAVRQRYFPKDEALFETDDLRQETSADQGFTADQQAMIGALLAAIAEAHVRAA